MKNSSCRFAPRWASRSYCAKRSATNISCIYSSNRFKKCGSLLVPGTVLVAFFVNIPLVSQTSTAVAVGTVLVPLLGPPACGI